MTNDDPPRLVSAGSPASEPLRRALDAGRAELPTSDQMGRVASGLAPLLGPGSGGDGSGGSAPASSGAGASGATITAAKVTLVALIGGTLAVGGGTWVRTAIEQSEPHSRAPRGVSLPERLAPSSREPPRSTPAVETRPASAPSVSVPSATTEIELLERAQDALPSSPALTLRLLREHAVRFPDGMLSQEREVLAIDALLRAGQRESAITRAQRFATRWPASAHNRRISVLIGE